MHSNEENTSCNSFLSDDLPLQQHGQPPRALILLFGWWGAHTRHLTKYADLYRQRNCLTIQAIAPPTAVLFMHKPTFDSCARHVAKRAAQILELYPDTPIVIHVFSNGGVCVLDRMEVLIQEARGNDNDDRNCSKNKNNENSELLLLSENVVGHIFDSAPAYPDPKAALRALENVFTSGWSYFFASILFRLFVFFTQTVPEVLVLATTASTSSTSSSSSVRLRFWDRIMYSKPTRKTGVIKQGFIYSMADHVTNAKHLEEFIAVRKDILNNLNDGTNATTNTKTALEENVLVLRLEDSPHVQHLRAYPKEYIEFIDKFLKAVGV